MSDSLRVAILGNLEPSIFWSTEWEYSDAWSRAGHLVYGYMEQKPEAWDDLIAWVAMGNFDLVQWTSTRQFADAAGEARQWELAAACRRAGIPLIGIHLDTWSNLKRENSVFEAPYFRAVDMLFTADGDAEDLWERAGVNHRWLLPAISERWLGLGEPDPKYDCDVVFVGGWHNYGHKEWTHRSELIEHLSQWYGDRFLALPRQGQPRIVGDELNRVYASAKVAVGDSCLVPHPDGRPKRSYCSDRVPETLGRGGILVHPSVEGIDEAFGRHLVWELGDWAGLKEVIDGAVSDRAEWADGSRMAARLGNIGYTEQHNTYTRRVRTVVETLQAEGMI
jgi:hypothetical protein